VIITGRFFYILVPQLNTTPQLGVQSDENIYADLDGVIKPDQCDPAVCVASFSEMSISVLYQFERSTSPRHHLIRRHSGVTLFDIAPEDCFCKTDLPITLRRPPRKPKSP
jgi:hypothetical protein